MKYSTTLLLKRTLVHGRLYWLHIVSSFFLNVLSAPLALLIPLPLKIIVDSAFGKQPLPSGIRYFFPNEYIFSFSNIILIAVAFLILIELLSQLLGLINWVLNTYLGEKLVLSFRSLLFNHIQRLSLAYHDRTGISDSLYRIQYDANSIRLVISSLSTFITATLTVLSMLYVMMTIEWHFAIITLAIIPPLVILTKISRSRLKSQWSNVKKQESAAMSVIYEALSSLRVVKAFVTEKYEEQRFVLQSDKAVKSQIKVAYSTGLFDATIGLVLAIGAAAFLYTGSLFVQNGKITLGELILLVAYLAQLFSPLKTLTKQFTSLQSSFVGLERAYALIDKEKDVAEQPNAVSIKRVSGSIRFENVSFQYNNNTPIIKNISFEVKPGQRIGIMGSTGSGKTTLLNLLARFYEPTEGCIIVDGIDIRNYKLSDYRSQFSIVLQEPVLFSTSITENIAYGKPWSDNQDIEKAANQAHAHEFILRLPNGYQTEVGERGMQLSGGERQRISIARAFLKNAPILILDEPTSSIDIGTEQVIMESMRELMKDRTSFLITHRLDTLSKCDIIIHLEAGGIVDFIQNDQPHILKNKINSFKQKSILI